MHGSAKSLNAGSVMCSPIASNSCSMCAPSVTWRAQWPEQRGDGAHGDSPARLLVMDGIRRRGGKTRLRRHVLDDDVGEEIQQHAGVRSVLVEPLHTKVRPLGALEQGPVGEGKGCGGLHARMRGGGRQQTEECRALREEPPTM